MAAYVMSASKPTPIKGPNFTLSDASPLPLPPRPFEYCPSKAQEDAASDPSVPPLLSASSAEPAGWLADGGGEEGMEKMLAAVSTESAHRLMTDTLRRNNISSSPESKPPQQICRALKIQARHPTNLPNHTRKRSDPTDQLYSTQRQEQGLPPHLQSPGRTNLASTWAGDTSPKVSKSRQ